MSFFVGESDAKQFRNMLQTRGGKYGREKVNKKKFVRYKEGADIIIVNHVVQVVSLKNSRSKETAGVVTEPIPISVGESKSLQLFL